MTLTGIAFARRGLLATAPCHLRRHVEPLPGDVSVFLSLEQAQLARTVPDTTAHASSPATASSGHSGRSGRARRRLA